MSQLVGQLSMASQAEGDSPPSAIPAPEPTARPRSGSKSTIKSTADPILRNALRYTISIQEYELLHKYVLSRSRMIGRQAPSVNAFEKYMDGGSKRRGSRTRADVAKGKEKDTAGAPSGGEGYNVRVVRHALRVFAATALGMKAYETAMARLGKDKEYVPRHCARRGRARMRFRCLC